jgi:uroporphyrinogen decarboxylase
MTSRERFLAACRCEPLDRPPCWIMRQAGRYLPEYRAIRAAHSFAEMVHDPELAAEVTLQPVRRFGFDAAILFSDILAVPEAMGVGYTLKEGEGIEMERRIESSDDVEALVSEDAELFARLGYVYDAMLHVRGELGSETALLGFAGSPWTLACYLAEGRGATGGAFTRALLLADEDPSAFRLLMEKLSDVVALHLTLQLCAGADAVQIFDSWAAAAPSSRYGELSLKWIGHVVSLMPEGVPVIVYAKGVSTQAREIAACGARVVSVDHSADLRAVADALPVNAAIQGNLDPALMEGAPEAVKIATGRLLESMRGRKGFIANLGHGITPAARTECVAAFVEAVRNFK